MKLSKLKAIREEFEEYKNNNNLNNLQKTMRYVALMNQLEIEYNTFVINPTSEQLELEEVKLYREISFSRDL